MSTPDIIVLHGNEGEPSYLGVSRAIREKKWSPPFSACGEILAPLWGYSTLGAGPRAAELRNRLVSYDIPVNSYRYRELQGSPGDIQNQLILLKIRTNATIRDYAYQESNKTSMVEKKETSSAPDFIILGDKTRLVCVHTRIDLRVKPLPEKGVSRDVRALERAEKDLIRKLAEVGVDSEEYLYFPVLSSVSTEDFIKDIQEVFKGSVTVVQFFDYSEEGPATLEEGSSKMKNKFNIADRVVIKQKIGFWLYDPEDCEKKKSIVSRVSGVFEDKPGKRYMYYLDGVMGTTYTEEDLSADIKGEVENRINGAIENTEKVAAREVKRLKEAHKLLLKVLAGDIEEEEDADGF